MPRLPNDSAPFTEEDLLKAANYLISSAECAVSSGKTSISLRIPIALRLADALLETINRKHP